jgi:hypothetical protein
MFVSDSTSMSELHSWFSVFSASNDADVHVQLVLAIIETDSTITYYRLHNQPFDGLKE